jgi:MoxR-like ATPase
MFALTAGTQRGACLFGPRGSGKTTAVHRLTESLGVRLITYQAAAGCTIDDLVGVRDLRDGRTVFTPGPLADALAADCVLLIEEANTMHPGVFSKLNTLTDGSGDSLRLPDGSALPVGPGFRVVLAFNEGYSGTREVNAALRDRLMPIYADYLPPESESRMIRDRTGCDEETATGLVQFATKVRVARAESAFDLSPRALFRLLDLIRYCGESWPDAFEHAILDLVGDPLDRAPQRECIRQIADLDGMMTWDLPTFGVAADATAGEEDAQ